LNIRIQIGLQIGLHLVVHTPPLSIILALALILNKTSLINKLKDLEFGFFSDHKNSSCDLCAAYGPQVPWDDTILREAVHNFALFKVGSVET
jgi:hypothetical protein